MTFIYLLEGTTSFPDPGNWNPVNTVEVIGMGAVGTGRTRMGSICPVYGPGFAGSGGGYGLGHNRMELFPVPILIASGGSVLSSNDYYNNWGDPGGGSSTAGNLTPGAVYAGNARYGVGMGYGDPYAGVAGGPDVGYAGGGGGHNGVGATYGASGGGAAGPHGAGAAGGDAATTLPVGGASDGGTVVSPASPGATGTSGTQWDSSHGTGSGGVGNTGAGNGGNAGSFGGGGGGGGGTLGSQGGTYGHGLIVITYAAYVPPPPSKGIIMA